MNELYIFTNRHNHCVKYLTTTDGDGLQREGLLVANSRESADAVAAKLNLTPCLVGSLEGETIELHIKAAYQDGINGAWVVTMKDGQLRRWWQDWKSQLCEQFQIADGNNRTAFRLPR